MIRNEKNSKNNDVELNEELAQKLADAFERLADVAAGNLKQSIESLLKLEKDLREKWVSVRDEHEKELVEQGIIIDETTTKVIDSKWYNRWYYTCKAKKEFNKWIKLAGMVRFFDDCIKDCDNAIKGIENEIREK